MSNINSVNLTGNLTADPESVEFQGGGSLTKLRIAVNGGYTNRTSGEFVETVSYFDIEVGNGQARACAQHLKKGRYVAITGRLEQQRWENNEGENRSKVVVKAARVEFGPMRDDNAEASAPVAASTSEPELPAETEGLTPAVVGTDDDIPF